MTCAQGCASTSWLVLGVVSAAPPVASSCCTRLVLAMRGCPQMLHLQQLEHPVQTGRSSCKSVELRVAAGCVTIVMAAMWGAYCSLLGVRGGLLRWEHFLHAVVAVQCHGISLGGRCRVINTGHVSLGGYAKVAGRCGTGKCVVRTSMHAGMPGSQWHREPVIPDDQSVFAESVMPNCDTWATVVRGADLVFARIGARNRTGHAQTG